MTKPEDNTAPVDDTTAPDEVQEDQDVDSTDDWDEAFDSLYDKEPDSGDKDESDESDDSNDDDKSGEPDDKTDEGEAAGDSEGAEKNNSDKENVVENNDGTKDGEENDPTTQQRQAVKEALKEVYNEQQAASAALNETISEALSVVRPNGIEDPRVDSDGDPIKGPEDVEKLYNPNTGELFTPSEAQAWYRQATERYQQELEAAKGEAEYVAHVNQRLSAGREAVIRNYGEFIKDNPEIAQKVLNSYMATVRIGGDENNQYIADAPVDILEFYNDVMYPYVELAEKKKEAQEAAAAAEQAKKEANKRAKAQRDESRDFPVSVGEDASKAGDDLDWDDAFKQYYGNR